MSDSPVDWEKVAAFAILSGDYDADGGSWWDRFLTPFERDVATASADYWRSHYEKLMWR